MIWKRNSFVQNMNIKSVQIGSVVEIGDTVHLNANSYALAVQREKQLFFGNEGNFQNFPAFKVLIPTPPLPPVVPVTQKNNDCSNIRVGNINILGMSTSALIQIGSTNHVNLEARIQHIRQVEADQKRV